jgi:hypothetical protein
MTSVLWRAWLRAYVAFPLGQHLEGLTTPRVLGRFAA